MKFLKAAMVAGLLAIAACGPNELDKPNQDFLQALKNQDVNVTYGFFSDALKKEVDIEKWTQFVDAAKMTKWSQTGMGFENSVSYREYEVDFENGKKATFRVSWISTDTGPKIVGYNRKEIP